MEGEGGLRQKWHALMTSLQVSKVSIDVYLEHRHIVELSNII